jgi:hypothetical protein
MLRAPRSRDRCKSGYLFKTHEGVNLVDWKAILAPISALPYIDLFEMKKLRAGAFEDFIRNSHGSVCH